MTQADDNRARYYRVSAAKWPIEKYLLCNSAREAAEEFAALFDLGELFDQVEIMVSLSDARGKRQTQQFTVRSSNMRVYEAVWGEDLSEPEEELEGEAMDESRELPLEDSIADEVERETNEWWQLDAPERAPLPASEQDEEDKWWQRDLVEPVSSRAPEQDEEDEWWRRDLPEAISSPASEQDQEDEWWRRDVYERASLPEQDDELEHDEPEVLKILAAANEIDPPDDDPDDSSSSGLRRLAGLATRGYGTLVKGLFGRRRGRAA